MKHNWTPRLSRLAAQCVLGTAGLILLTIVCFQLGADITTAGFAYVILITLLSLLGSFAASCILSIAAVACLNYFFTPPLFDLRVDALQDILALAAFATTSLIINAFTTRLRRSADTLQQAVHSVRRTRDELDAKVVELEQSKKALEAQIAERKRSENALRQSEMLLAEAQKISRTGSFALRAASREVIWSAELFRIFGWERTVKPTLDLLLERTHPEDRASVRSVLERAWKEKRDWEHRHRLLMPDGSVKHLHAVGHAVTNPTGELEFFGAVMDISNAVQAEGELYELRTGLAHVNRVMTLGELTASIAHEVNQPLTAVVTDAGSALRWLNGQSPDLSEARQALSRIQKSGNRAAEVIAHIRALAKKSSVHMSQVNINEVIQSVIALARNEIERNRIALRTQLNADLPAIRADRIQLQQVVLNLLMNAIEAMADGERRDLVVSSGQKAPHKVLVSVLDSGPGLDSQNVERLFEPFYTTKSGGMGMGLAICRSILENHGGRLSARANEPRGAIFDFELPIEEIETAGA